MKKILMLAVAMTACGLVFSGCAVRKYTSIKTLDVGTPVRPLPLTADLNISDQKVRGEAHGTLGAGVDEDRIVREATARALGQDPPKVEAPDVLVAMNVYKELRGRDVKVVVTGYPAWYHNFRTVNLGGGRFGESDSAWLILTHTGGGGGGVAVSGDGSHEQKGKLNFSETLKSMGAGSGEARTKGRYFGLQKTLLGSRSMTYEYLTVEGGWIRSTGMFYGTEFGMGTGKGGAFMLGAGTNWGFSYSLPSDLYLSVGCSAGFWAGDYETSSGWDMAFGGPFVRARWKIIELSYRGLMGISDEAYYGKDFAWVSQFKAGLHFEF